MPERRSRKKPNPLEEVLVSFLNEAHPDLAAEKPQFNRLLAKQFAGYIEVWRDNHPQNPEAIKRAQVRVMRWIDRNLK